MQIIEEIQLNSPLACGNSSYVLDINADDEAVVYSLQPPYDKAQTYHSQDSKIEFIFFFEDLDIFGVSETMNAEDIRLYDARNFEEEPSTGQKKFRLLQSNL